MFPPDDLEPEYVRLWWRALRILYGNCGPRQGQPDRSLPLVASTRTEPLVDCPSVPTERVEG
jgi:hypothetical protein